MLNREHDFFCIGDFHVHGLPPESLAERPVDVPPELLPGRGAVGEVRASYSIECLTARVSLTRRSSYSSPSHAYMPASTVGSLTYSS